MAHQIVVGLYPSRGIAEDAVNRLHTEGVSPAEISLTMLKEIAPITQPVKAELAMLDADPMLIGNVRDTYASFLKNGETVVLVRAETRDAALVAADVLRLFLPLAVDIIEPQPASAAPEGAR
ncbi:MAG: hypothetical protein ACREFB_03905 [Stellaceae bacterium]